MLEPNGRPMRVLLVGPVAPPRGGMATSLQELAAALPGAAVSVQILRTNPALGFLDHIPVLRTVLGFVLFVIQFLMTAPRCRVIHLLGASHWYFWLRCVPVLLMGRFLCRRVVLQYKGGLLDSFLARNGRAALWCMRQARVISVPSAFLARSLARHDIEARVVPNIADMQRFQWKTRSHFAPKLLVARSLEVLYGVDIVLQAFAQLRMTHPQATLAIAGDGSARARLETQAATIGGVTFHGAVDRATLVRLHESNDIFVNASRADNMPVSLIEAMASGLAIVSTDAGGIPDLVTPEREGLLVPVDDAAALHQALLDVISNHNAAEQRVVAARKRVAAFDASLVRQQLIALYRA
ncbi:MAG: glycosyltransferase family 1 protein [Planctomycetes bacterium]|nr:glycosyltransferase family 1 protein [Planctomycetota bacterium]